MALPSRGFPLTPSTASSCFPCCLWKSCLWCFSRCISIIIIIFVVLVALDAVFAFVDVPPRTPKDLGLLRNRDRRPARGCEEANTWHVAAPCRCWSRIEARNSPFGARTAEQTSRASAPSRALARLEQPGSCFQLQRGLVERCLRFEPAKIRERRRIWCWAGLGLLAVVVEVLWDVFACCGRVVWDKERALEVGTLLLLVPSFPARCFQIAPLSATEF